MYGVPRMTQQEVADVAAFEKAKRDIEPSIVACLERYRTVTEETLARLKQQGYPGGGLMTRLPGQSEPLAVWDIFDEYDYGLYPPPSNGVRPCVQRCDLH